MSDVYCSGFEVREQNVRSLGNAYAGVTVLTQDASAAFYNPAALADLEEKQWSLPMIVSQPDQEFKVTKALDAPDGVGILGVGNTKITRPKSDTLLPSFHYGARVTESMVFALSVATPFNINFSYDEGGIARYSATKTLLRSIDISPSIVYGNISDMSFAFGLDFLRTNFEFSNAYNTLNTNIPSEDGYQKLTGFDWSYGWHAGLMYVSPIKAVRVGLFYRSSFNLALRGKKHTLGCTGNVACTGYPSKLCSYDINSKATLPRILSFGVYIPVNQYFSLMGDIHYTNWLVFDKFKVYKGSKQIEEYLSFDKSFLDSTRIAIGLNLIPNEYITFRLGYARDPSPVTSSMNTSRMPYADSNWYSLGLTVKFNDRLTADLGYTKVSYENIKITEKYPTNNILNTKCDKLNKSALSADYQSDLYLWGFQINYEFED